MTFDFGVPPRLPHFTLASWIAEVLHSPVAFEPSFLVCLMDGVRLLSQAIL
jgi:hypothetical protein